MELKYPINFTVDGHHYNNGGNSISIGVLVTDDKRPESTVIERVYETKELGFANTFLAESNAVLKATELMPEFCVRELFPKYGNGGKRVVIRSDCRSVVESIKKSKCYTKFLRGVRNNGGNGNEIDEVEKILKAIQEKTQGYDIKYQKIKGRGQNPAHILCRIAEGRIN
ncbi:MAG: hypothetical protein GTN36_06220 [Candidatus Aenigmarchaeota archaeon]|nr:hypothetical protein [Candidatus Aenigmarchaeota archaeon]